MTVIAASSRGAVTASALSSPMIRSTPSEPPTAGMLGPPRDSIRWSYRPPPAIEPGIPSATASKMMPV